MGQVDFELVEAAGALIAARTDDAHHTTAAAGRASTGEVVTGVNVFHFTGGPCAELVVIGRAVAEGVGELTQIVAVGDRGRGILSPCGRCRQVLYDLLPTIAVVVQAGSEPRAIAIADLLPWAGRWDTESGTSPAAS